jgi:hypothetical protein
MDAHDQAEEEEVGNVRRFKRFARFWQDVMAAERAAQARARLEHALRTCCPELRRRSQAPPKDRLMSDAVVLSRGSGPGVRCVHLLRALLENDIRPDMVVGCSAWASR